MFLVKHISSWVFIQMAAKSFVLDKSYKEHNFLPRIVYGSNQKPHLKVWLIMLNSFFFFFLTDSGLKVLWKSLTILTFGNFSANSAITQSWSFISRSLNPMTKKPEELSVQAVLGETRCEFADQYISDLRLEQAQKLDHLLAQFFLSLVLTWFLFKSDHLCHWLFEIIILVMTIINYMSIRHCIIGIIIIVCAPCLSYNFCIH